MLGDVWIPETDSHLELWEPFSVTVLEMLVRDPEHTQNSGIHAQALRVSDSDCSGNGFVLSLLISCPNVLWFTLAKQEKKWLPRLEFWMVIHFGGSAFNLKQNKNKKTLRCQDIWIPDSGRAQGALPSWQQMWEQIKFTDHRCPFPGASSQNRLVYASD